MHRKQYASLDQLLALCKRNNLDITSESHFLSDNPDRFAASQRKANRAEVAKLARCSKDAVRSWALGITPMPLASFELLAYKWQDKKGLAYARKLSEGTQNETE